MTEYDVNVLDSENHISVPRPKNCTNIIMCPPLNNTLLQDETISVASFVLFFFVYTKSCARFYKK